MNLPFSFSIRIIIAFLVNIFFFPHTTLAQEQETSKFQILESKVTILSNTSSDDPKSLSELIGEPAAQSFGIRGYVLTSGYRNEAENATLALTVMPVTIDYEHLKPSTQVEKVINLHVQTESETGFFLMTSQDQPLTAVSGETIIDTNCDQGAHGYCTNYEAKPWRKNSTYGFGYSMKGEALLPDLRNSSFFRPFPASSRQEIPAVIMMQSGRSETNATASMTIRVNPPSNQPVGLYKNTLTFTAVAGL